MAHRPILAFDTSVLNRLVKQEDSEPCLAAILSGFEICLPEMTVGEILATPDPILRQKLFSLSGKLLGVGQGMLPAHWIIDVLVHQHSQNSNAFDWTRTNIRNSSMEDQIHRGGLHNDEALSTQQREGVRKLQRDFEDWFQEPKAAHAKKFNSGEEKRPASFMEWLLLQKLDGGRFWHSARSLYKAAFGVESIFDAKAVLDAPPSESVLKQFTEACPPFRSYVTAFELTYYDRCIRPKGCPKMDASRNDQMMSVYLPYCNQFLTAEKNEMQERCLRAVATAANIPVEIRSYDAFCKSFLVG